ncbi:hypothetical protein D3C85_1889690 [compost metagenome]
MPLLFLYGFVLKPGACQTAARFGLLQLLHPLLQHNLLLPADLYAAERSLLMRAYCLRGCSQL